MILMVLYNEYAQFFLIPQKGTARQRLPFFISKPNNLYIASFFLAI